MSQAELWARLKAFARRLPGMRKGILERYRELRDLAQMDAQLEG